MGQPPVSLSMSGVTARKYTDAAHRQRKGGECTMFTIDQLVARPIDVVFQFLTAVEATPNWYSAVKSVKRVSSDETAQVPLFLFVRELPGGLVTNTVAVSAMEPNRAFELRSIDGPTPFVYRYELEEQPHKWTLVRLIGSISGEGLSVPFKVLQPFAETLFQRGMKGNLQSMRQLLEQGRPEGGRRFQRARRFRLPRSVAARLRGKLC